MSWKRILLLIVWGYFSFLMLEITIRYLPLESDIAFLAIKQDEVTTVKHYLWIFYVHVFSSIFVLLIGLLLFFKLPKKLHQYLGYIYVVLIIFFAAPSGLFIGYYANGEIIAKTAFIILGILWWFFTVNAVVKIKQKNIISHRNFMMRSYALTLSALTLRAWKVILVYLFQPAPMDVYQIIAWLGFIPNLLLVELYINKTKPYKL